jgi:hypothetical protein
MKAIAGKRPPVCRSVVRATAVEKKFIPAII